MRDVRNNKALLCKWFVLYSTLNIPALVSKVVPLGKGDDKRILILEAVSYSAIWLMGARETEKEKYEDTRLEGLRKDGWDVKEPVLYIGIRDAMCDTFQHCGYYFGGIIGCTRTRSR
eukprot:4392348-Pyramimonas_sp.AAC.3